MTSFFFTFGSGQYHGLLTNDWVEIEAPDELTARQCMVNGFGQKWCGCYDQEAWTREVNRYFPGSRLAKLDQYGNILERP